MIENDALQFANKVPGGRKAFPFLTSLINIDELWLYQYHERDYGPLMTTLFETIQKF